MPAALCRLRPQPHAVGQEIGTFQLVQLKLAKEYRGEQLARDAKSLMIYAGSNEIQVTHIAKGLLGS